jgi:hypothetical protein
MLFLCVRGDSLFRRACRESLPRSPSVTNTGLAPVDRIRQANDKDDRMADPVELACASITRSFSNGTVELELSPTARAYLHFLTMFLSLAELAPMPFTMFSIVRAVSQLPAAWAAAGALFLMCDKHSFFFPSSLHRP